MAKVRVHELAKEFGVESKVVLAKLGEMGEFVKSASSTVEPPVVKRFTDKFGDELKAASEKKAAKKAPAKKAAPAKEEEAAPAAEAPAPAAEAPAPAPAETVSPAKTEAPAPAKAETPFSEPAARTAPAPGPRPGPKPGPKKPAEQAPAAQAPAARLRHRLPRHPRPRLQLRPRRRLLAPRLLPRAPRVPVHRVRVVGPVRVLRVPATTRSRRPRAWAAVQPPRREATRAAPATAGRLVRRLLVRVAARRVVPACLAPTRR